jgi:hypothetical protein
MPSRSSFDSITNPLDDAGGLDSDWPWRGTSGQLGDLLQVTSMDGEVGDADDDLTAARRPDVRALLDPKAAVSIGVRIRYNGFHVQPTSFSISGSAMDETVMAAPGPIAGCSSGRRRGQR